jgi:uncharacterized protein YfaS (alpha-2-macroglobulin family)
MRGGGWIKSEPPDSLRWFVFDDRRMYRPGEEVHLKGWIRRIGRGKEGDVGSLGEAASRVAYAVKDSRGNDVLKGTLPSMLSGALTPRSNTAHHQPRLCSHSVLSKAEPEGLSRSTSITQIREFRRPEFEVTARRARAYTSLERGGATVTAAYYAGGGLPDAEWVDSDDDTGAVHAAQS